MSRRKHLLQSLEQEIEPPGEGQHIVRAVGSRGSNIIEVEFPDGRNTLCLLPAKFHKKLWIKKGNFLIVEDAAEADGRVTGQILSVLFADHVKQLRRMPGVWPPEFERSSSSGTTGTGQAAEQLAALGLAESDSDDDDKAAAGGRAAAAAPTEQQAGGASPPAARQQGGEEKQRQQAASSGQQEQQRQGAAGAEQGEEEGEEGYTSEDDDLPPIPRFNNRKIIEYEVSDSESEED